MMEFLQKNMGANHIEPGGWWMEARRLWLDKTYCQPEPVSQV